jgi:predicted RNase H-like HicB family nuclease
MTLAVETQRKEDGRWLAEVAEIPGVMAYGQSREEAVNRVESLALRAIADRLEHGEAVPEVAEAFLIVA